MAKRKEKIPTLGLRVSNPKRGVSMSFSYLFLPTPESADLAAELSENAAAWIVDNWEGIAALAWRAYTETGRGMVMAIFPDNHSGLERIAYIPASEEVLDSMSKGLSALSAATVYAASNSYKPKKEVCCWITIGDISFVAVVTPEQGYHVPPIAALPPTLDPDVWGDVFPELRGKGQE